MRLIGRLAVAIAVSALAAVLLYVVFVRTDDATPPNFVGEPRLVQIAGG